MEPPAADRAASRPSSLWLVVPLIVIFGTAAAGNALFPALVNGHPLVLLGLNATTRHLVATSTSVDVVPYVAVALARRLAEDPLLYLLGRWHGDAAVDWMSRRLGGGRLLRTARRRFRLWGAPLVFFFPGGVVCVLAGAAGMPAWLFLVLNVAGTLVTILLLRSAGEQVAGPLTSALDFVGDNVLTLTVASVLLTVLLAVRRHRQEGRPDD
ncbi:MAG: DedA family protein [Acidimicrobiales bacterium]